MTACGCSRSAGAICALFATLAACVFVAEDSCRDGGGRVSDSAWACVMAAGSSTPLWSLVSPGALAVAALLVGVPVYFGVNAISRRIIASRGLPMD